MQRASDFPKCWMLLKNQINREKHFFSFISFWGWREKRGGKSLFCHLHVIQKGKNWPDRRLQETDKSTFLYLGSPLWQFASLHFFLPQSTGDDDNTLVGEQVKSQVHDTRIRVTLTPRVKHHKHTVKRRQWLHCVSLCAFVFVCVCVGGGGVKFIREYI